MTNPSPKADDLDIPELKREQLGRGVRGKYFKRFVEGSNVVVLRPDLQKIFPTSDAVNEALTRYVAFAQEARSLTSRATKSAPKRRGGDRP